ncbi:uncharacterized protein LOC109062036 isoform X2 [Cyprinus carpio]|uniref:Uncharacterized protein LOC109062036 isoform X2 n=1 Tax=Cyprinus carpio TaxID=7962 RepID=A0A9Q9W599_CYPCA|nr:uncharacterized protein LOC109062036 isoform X2 [Cyprinus carpio]
MACAQRSAKEYLRNNRKDLVTGMKNLRLIIENLYQEKVFNDYDVDALKDKKKKFGKARCILDRVIKQGEKASYELLKILDVTKKRTLDPGLHYWISCSPFRDEDTEPSYSFGTKPCKNYQKQLKDKAKEKCFFKYLLKTQGNFSFIPLVLETDSEVKSPQCKINLKSKKCKKLRPKKLRAYIPNEGQAISPEDLLRWQDKNILIIGKPGVGKTTVVQEMLRLWGEKDGREIDYMFYFDQSVLAHSSVASLEALLFDVYSKPMEKDRKEVFQDIEENSENVVIVFDCVMGLEENVILWKIMKHKLLPDAKVVITCRSEEEDDPLFSDWPTRTVYVQGFSEESIKTYYQEMLGNNHVLLDVILKNQELFSLSHVPLYAFMIVDLIKFKNDTVCNHPHTVTEMYIHIFRLAVKKHGNKQNKQMDMYLKEKKDQIDPLMENAFSATKQKCLNLPHISSDETDICHAFLKMITTTDSPTSATTYCAFLHNTMQEFFSALWLLGHPDEIEKVLQLCQTEEHKHMRHVLPFLCGLLSEHNTRLLKCLFPEDQIKKTSDWFIEKLLDTFFQAQSESEEFDLLYVCQCLYELQSPKACLIFLEKMNHQLDLEVDLDPHQCCALSYVIGQSRDKEVYLNLDNCTVADVGMDMMLSCSPNIRLKTCKEPLKQTTFFVEFFHKSSQCDCKLFEVRGRYKPETFNALLDLYSHVKNYETQTGRSYLPALQSVFQSPDEWIIDLSERKSSVLLEVLKLQTEKKTVKLRGCSEEESEVMSFLQCLPHISQLRFWDIYNKESMSAVRFLLNLCVAAVEADRYTGTRFSTLLSSVCSYKTFPFDEDDVQSDFLLDLYSHVKNYETQTGRSYLPALQSVFQSPDEWIIDLSERKSSVLLEVLKLQTEKKSVKLRSCSEEESEVMSFLQCLQHISQLRFWDIDYEERMSAVRFLLDLCVAAVETDRYTRTRFSTLLSSVCSYKTFPFNYDGDDQSDFLLDLYSHVKNYETQTGRSYLPVLQSVFQLPDEWIIDLSERKISVLLEVLKLQTEKKTVELRGCSEEESEVMSFLQCLPHISQLRFWFIYNEERMSAVRFLLNLCVAAVETDRYTGTRFSTLLSSVCSYKTFPFDEEYEHYVANVQSDFLLDLYSHVKNYETQTGRSYLPALQSVFQSPDEWIIDLSERKSSVLLEVLKLQTEKKTVKLRRCSEEESDVMSFLQCLPHISQLRFWDIDDEERMSAVRFLLNLCVAAVETDRYTGTRFSTLLSSVCSYKTFPFNKDGDVQSDFLLDLYSHVKNYETQTGRSYLPVLQSVFQSPDEWIIDLSKRRSSVLLEVLKLQTEKKTVELRGCSEEESEVMSFLQCLPHISQLRFWFIYKESRMSAVRFLLDLCVAAVETDRHTGTRFSTLLSSVCSYKTFPFNKDGDVQIDFLLDLYSHVKNYETQTGRSYLPALQSVFQSPDEWIIDLSERKSSVLLEVLKLQTEKKTVELRGCSEEESEVMSFLQCLPHISQLRLPKETVQKLAECVCEAQEEELTRCFLQKVSGDLTSCSLSWEQLHYFLQQRIQQITVDFRKSNIQCRISEILPFLNRIQFKRMSSSFMLCAIREIYESGSAGFVSGLLSSVENYINLQSRELDSVHCEALRFTLQHCTAASLNLLWTSIPEEELQSILPLFTHLSHLSVDRLLLLKMLHCCSVSDVQQEAASVLLSILQHKLDFSCRSALDLTTNTDSEPLHLTADDCRVTSRFIQRAHSDTKTRLILQDCEIHTAGMDQLFPVLRSVQLCCDKPLLLQFLAHVRPEEAQSLSGALGEELDLSQTQLDPQVWRGLELILEYSEGLTELDLSQCGLTDHSLDLLLPNLHKAQIIDFSGNSITDAGAQNLHMIVNHNRNIKTVRCVSECHSDAQSYLNCY